MRSSIAVIVAALAAVSACDAKPEPVTPPDFAAAFPNLPLPPGGRLVTRTGGTDALQLTFRSPGTLEGVADYFRDALSRPGWRLVSDTKDSIGTVQLYAEGPKAPMWVRVQAVEGEIESVMTGAVPGADTTFARKQSDVRDTTNTLRPR